MNEIKVNDIIEFGLYPQTKAGNGFKIEPIKWRVLEINNVGALLLSEKILDVHNFDSSSSNYSKSEIRKWLNEDFYNKAFNEEEKSRIVITNIDNSARSTNPDKDPQRWNSGNNKYACEKTNDKVFLLSQQEVTKKEYGFNTDTDAYDTSRKKQGTDYSKSQGLWVSSSNGNSYWWLRSPSYYESSSAQFVDTYGSANHFDYVSFDYSGVVPALKIKLS